MGSSMSGLVWLVKPKRRGGKSRKPKMTKARKKMDPGYFPETNLSGLILAGLPVLVLFYFLAKKENKNW